METLGLLGILCLWGALGLVPWFATLILSRGRAPLIAFPLAFAAGIGGGALVPALGAKDLLGFWISLSTALVAGTAASYITIRWARSSGSLDPDAGIAKV
jgi:hypothetical protein